MEEDLTEGLRGQEGEILIRLSDEVHSIILLPRFATEFETRRGEGICIISFFRVLQACVQGRTIAEPAW